MPGLHITGHQMRLYMSYRQNHGTAVAIGERGAGSLANVAQLSASLEFQREPIEHNLHSRARAYAFFKSLLISNNQYTSEIVSRSPRSVFLFKAFE